MITALVAAGGLFAALPAAAAPPNPTTTGCSAAYELVSVAAVEPLGYSPTPRLVDEAGNSNGLVCRRPVPLVFLRLLCNNDCPVDLIYDWRDDSIPKS
ncbi:MAG TPA: hypothetical protein VGK53_22075 [Propionicimonas sp.]